MNFDEVCSGSVIFQPTAPGERVAYLSASNSDGGQPIYLPLIGSTPNPSSALFSNGITFGPQVIGANVAPYPFQLFNQSQSAVTFTGLSIAGSAAADFQISQNGCTGTPVPSQFSCQYDLSFTPSAVGIRSAVLLVTYQGGPATLEVPIIGTGTPTRSSIGFNQTSLFPFAVTVGEPVSQQAAVTNTGSTPIDFSNFSITGPAASDYTITNNGCTSGIGVNGGCGITLQFTPSKVGLRSAILQLSDTASGSPQNISLLGAGSNGAPVLVYNNVLNFSAETLGSSGHLQINLSGSATGDITFSSIAITGPNASDFSLVNGCPTTIPAQSPLATCSLTVTFTPSVTGLRTAQVELTDNATGNPQIIPIAGVGLTAERSISFFPAMLSFPEFQGIGYTVTQGLGITNTGNSPITFTGFQISGPAASDFSIVSNSCKIIEGGCRMTISFTPSATGLRTAALYMADNAAQSPQSIVLAGVGFPVSSLISISPQSLNFSSTPVGVSSTQLPSVRLFNEGTVPVTIQSMSLSGANSSDFASSISTCSTPPFSLVPKGACDFSFQFTPSATGTRTASFSVSSSATNGPQAVELSGSGE